jgi:predicted transcriptional regulator
MNVLLSIRPEYAERIFAGQKLFEFRRRLPKHQPVTVVVYVTAPVMRIVGEFTVEHVLHDTPERLWNLTHQHAGISFEFFCSYFVGRAKAYALRIGAVKRYDQPIEPYEALENFCPPQFFRYLK